MAERVTLRARWLGERLRVLREAAEMKQEDAARRLSRAIAGISRFERAELKIPRQDLKELLELYGISQSDPRYNELLKLWDDAWRTDWWDGYAGEVEKVLDQVWLESQATEIQTFMVLNVEGLLQTADYARSVIRAAGRDASNQQIDRWVELRMQRQAILTRHEPPLLSVVLDEAALRRPVGGRDVMAAQLRRLAEQAALPHIDLRVLPFDAGAHPGQSGEFRLFRLPEPFPPSVVCVESQAGLVYLEPPKTAEFTDLYDRLREVALDPDQSLEFIATATAHLGSLT